MKENLGDILADVGQLVIDLVGSDSEGVLLYAEGARSVFGATIFKDMGDHVLCFFPNRALSDALFKIWDVIGEVEEWSGLIYSISDGQFDAKFEYSDEWDDEEFYDDRRNRLEAERYGNKRIIYVPKDRNGWVSTEN